MRENIYEDLGKIADLTRRFRSELRVQDKLKPFHDNIFILGHSLTGKDLEFFITMYDQICEVLEEEKTQGHRVPSYFAQDVALLSVAASIGEISSQEIVRRYLAMAEMIDETSRGVAYSVLSATLLENQPHRNP